MNNASTQQIWKPNTGITDIEGDPSALSASAMPGIKDVWARQREHLKDTALLEDFTEKLRREWAIETGIIENLYEIERGVTRTLIKEGFSATVRRTSRANTSSNCCATKKMLSTVFSIS